jgi:hypothetical protein
LRTGGAPIPASTTHHYDVFLPIWLYAMAFAALPLMTALRHLRIHRRRISGLCHTCGYDLRASAERCPECGTGVVTRSNQP